MYEKKFQKLKKVSKKSKKIMLGLGISILNAGKKQSIIQKFLKRVNKDNGENLLNKTELTQLLPENYKEYSLLGIPSSRGKVYTEVMNNPEITSSNGWQLGNNTIYNASTEAFDLVDENGLTVRQGVSVSGNTYEITITIDSVTSGEIRIYASGTQSAIISSPGTYNLSIVGGSVNNNFLGINPKGTATVSISKFSAKLITEGKLYSIIGSDFTITRPSVAYEFNSSNQFARVERHTPRISFAGGYKGYRGESERTNLRVNSSDFISPDKTFGGSSGVTPTILGTSIIEGGKALQVRETTATGIHRIRVNPDNLLVQGTTYTSTSIFSLTGNRNTVRIYEDGQSGVILTCNVRTGAITSAGQNVLSSRLRQLSFGSVSDADIVYSLSITYTATGTIGRPITEIAAANGDLTYTGDPAEGLTIYQHQYELASYETNPIVTGEGFVTRAGELAKITAGSSNIGQTEGTIHLKAYLRVLSTSRVLKRIAVNAANFFEIITTASNAIRVRVNLDGVTTNILTSAVFTEGVYDIKFAYKDADYALSVNGVVITSTIANAFPKRKENLFPYSRSYGWYEGNNTSSSWSQNDPDGGNAAVKITSFSANWSFYDNLTLVPGATYNISVFAKAVTVGTKDTFSLRVGSNIVSGFVATDTWTRFDATIVANSFSQCGIAPSGTIIDIYFYNFQISLGSDLLPPTFTNGSIIVESDPVFSDVYLGSNAAGTLNADDSISLYGLIPRRLTDLELES